MMTGYKHCPNERWKQNEVEFLKENYANLGNKELCKFLSKSVGQIHSKANRLGLKKILWTSEQEIYLKNNYHTKTAKELALELNKKVNTIIYKLFILRLLKTPQEIGSIQKRLNKNYAQGENHYKWKDKVMSKTCKYCGKEFFWKKVKHIRSNWSKREFCSIKCSTNFIIRYGEKNNFWNGGESNWSNRNHLYSTKFWIKLRKKIIEEDKCCFVCGTTEKLQIHHKIRYKEGGENTRNNLITLCNKHHQQIHTLERFYKQNHSPRDFDKLLQEVINKFSSAQRISSNNQSNV